MWNTLCYVEELKCFCWKLKIHSKNKFKVSLTMRAGYFGLKCSNLTFTSYWKRGLGTLSQYVCAIYWYRHLNFLQYVFSAAEAFGTHQCLKTVSACSFSFWDALSDTVFLEKTKPVCPPSPPPPSDLCSAAAIPFQPSPPENYRQLMPPDAPLSLLQLC